MQIPPMMSIEELRRRRAEEADQATAERSRIVREKVTNEYNEQERTVNQRRRGGLHSKLYLQGVSGAYAEAVFPLGECLTFGRNKEQTNIRFGADAVSVSGVHCKVWIDTDGLVKIQDLGSTNGTYFGDGTRLEDNKAYRIKIGEEFWVGSENERFKVIEA